jgi:WD40 repeat protein
VSEDRSVILWDLQRGEIKRHFELLGVGGLYGLDLSADGRRALINTRDGPAILLDLQSGQITESSFGRRGRIETAILHPDGRHVLSGASSGDVRLSDLSSGAEVRCTEHDRRHVGATSVDISPDGQWGLTGFRDGSVILWSVDSGNEVRRLVGHTTAITGGVRFGRNGHTAVSGAGGVWGPARDDALRLWNLESGLELGRLEGHRDPVTDIDLSLDGHTLVSASHDGTVRVWDVSTLLCTGASDVLDTSISTPLRGGPVLLDVHPQRVWSVALSPDALTVLVGLGRGNVDVSDYSLRQLDARTGREIRRFVGHSEPVLSVAFSPDGRLALSGAFDGTVYVWDVASGQVVRRLVGHTGGVLCVAFGPQGRLAASSARDETVIVWDIATGEARRRFLGHRGEVLAVCFVPGRQTLISAGADLTVREWRIDATQRELRAWIEANRYLPELTPEQRAQAHLEALDGAEGA